MLIEVEDDGPGMDEPTRHRIFDPFFTTKGSGGGLGLGLFLARSFVEQMNGQISWRSVAGSGTEVTLDLPSA